MTFLASLANTLLNTYGTNLSQVTVVFPNKRASLFLNEELARLCDKPIWSPAYTTISDLFRSMSSLEVADPIKLICDLHKSFVQCTGIEESLDHFYGWGQILLSDFDDVDKHLAPADKVFANLRDIHEFDDDTYLTQPQRDIIRKFFSNFNEGHNSELKQRFLSLWSHIYDIYLDFNKRLTAQGLAYEGSLYRQVIETLKDNKAESLSFRAPTLSFRAESRNLEISPLVSLGRDDRKGGSRDDKGTQELFERNNTGLQSPVNFVFAGFNLLHPVEKALIALLGENATLIQDTDEETPKHITFISAPTENSQARYVATWLQEHDRIQAGRKTAVVLADESLLQSVIHCIPDEVTKVNITTGYPLSQTAAATQGKHQSPLEAEAQFRIYTILNRIQALIDCGDLQVNDATLQRLLTQIIASTTIPFHGEPLEGIQIMGILETRNIDFDHVLLLSCNEGNIPKGINDTSFIPYSIRKAYGLTTIDNKVAIYENYFRRLLQRAKDVTLIYNNATNDGKTGEMSRFMLQLMVESSYPITHLTLQGGQSSTLHHPQPITKTPAIMERLKDIKLLSPSALSRFLRCPLRFFYQDVCKFSEYEDPEDDLIDNRLFGNIFHKAAHLLYSSLITDHSSLITAPILSALLKDESRITRAVDQAIKLELFHIEDPMAKIPPLNGLQLINRQVIIRYIHQLLEVDLRLTPFTILALEREISPCASLSRDDGGRTLSRDDGRTTVKLGGVVDRIDLITLPDGTERIRIIDYKTSNYRLKPFPDVASIFDPANIKHHSDYYLQSILYSCLLEESKKESRTFPSKSNPHERSLHSFHSVEMTGEGHSVEMTERKAPCLLFIQHAGAEDYDPTLVLGKTPITDVREIKDEFMEHLTTLITEIYDPAKSFIPTDDRSRCRTCPFLKLCC